MKQDPLIVSRFEELIEKGRRLISTARSSSGGAVYIDRGLGEEWAISSISLIGRVLGRDSEHYGRFKVHTEHVSSRADAERALAILVASLEDYKGGYLFDTSKRIQAEIFNDFLEQAEYLLNDGYFQVSAVVAGAVLEDTLRKLCASKGGQIGAQPKLDAMNAELAKVGLYDKLLQKKITWLADIRNKAAHGKWTEFSREDAAEMLSAIRRFTEEHT
jgi:hypothetical protein